MVPVFMPVVGKPQTPVDFLCVHRASCQTRVSRPELRRRPATDWDKPFAPPPPTGGAPLCVWLGKHQPTDTLGGMQWRLERCKGGDEEVSVCAELEELVVVRGQRLHS